MKTRIGSPAWLWHTTALASGLCVAAFVPTLAVAQTVPAGNTSAVSYSNSGTSGPAQQTPNEPGAAGGAGADYTIDVQTAQTIKDGTAQSLIAIQTTGGSGGFGGASTAGYDSDGPLGGAGGKGGDVTFTLDPPTDSGVYNVLEASASSSNGVLILSHGGRAGDGQQNEGEGNGGVGGTGGDGGKLTFTWDLNPQQPVELNFVEATNAAINLFSGGGNGGASGESSGAGGKKITGRKGGAGGAGGEIDVAVAGNINGYSGGSGIMAFSVGGDGGAGGDASDDTATATGSDGGDAGVGGNVTINVTGGIVAAAGPDKAATGPVQNFDSSTDPTQTVPLDTSVRAGAILAVSQGGEGGVAGLVNGFVTKSGNGAAGGQGGSVIVNLGGSSVGVLDNQVISTTGYNTFGVMALSAGGDGGDGDSGGGAFFRSGGNGGTGGDGNSAQIFVGNDTATPYAKIETAGDDSDALVALSVGGGGGYSGDLNDSSGGGGAGFSLFVGGTGGNGGNGINASLFNGYYDPPPTDGSNAAFHPGDVIITNGAYSRGMVAQTVGGGGGRGGDATSTSFTSAVTIGGKGGSGGTGGQAEAVNFGLVSTTGSHSSGIFSQSVGGGGGSGGAALSRAIGQQITVSIAVGGNGGSGGDATEADIYNLGQIQTLGANAHAGFAQSVGGGGGLGGAATAENYSNSMPDAPSIAVSAAVGGKGGTAGTGGTINVVNTGLLQTQGQDAYGVFAQSVGGGGGAGGDATASNMAIQQAKLNFNTAIGGSGGGGGSGGKVNVWNSGLVSTSASTAIGVFAQSVGGGGGAGGFGTVDQGAFKQAGNYSVELALAIGGQGGVSGDGNDILVNNYISANTTDPGYFSDFGVLSIRDLTGNGGILTVGDMAPGIFAQSVGGGGGHGGDSSGKGGNGQLSVNVAIGGGGGAGGKGGSVTVHNGGGAIQTYGAQSYGVFGQSVGGGGGTGGNAVTGSGDDPEYALSKQAVNLASGNTAQNPTEFTQVTDQVWDWKDNLKGFWDDKNRLSDLYDLNNDISTAEKPSFFGLEGTDLTVDVGGGAGGKAGAGGNGGNVVIDSSGSIITHGALAHGVFAQSVGGGGGVGGASAPVTSNDQTHNSVIESAISVGGQGGKGGDGGAAVIANNSGGDIETSGDLAFGIFSQSVGGGGGVAGASTPNAGLGNPMALSFGGAGIDESTVSGQGSLANAYNDAMIQTSGDHGIGMVVQSVGGGGGIVAVTGQTQDSDTGLFYSTSQTLATGTVKPALAENWQGTKNIGGPVTALLNSNGVINTSGVNAFGILAQSIGGGGGLMVVDPNNQVTVNQLATNPNDVAPSGGNKSGLVTVTTQGQTHINTSGNGAVGIVAQSLGGAGVLLNGFDGVNVNTGSSQVYQDRWDMGMGGAVTVNNNTNIFTTGEYAHGVFAQVASGTGGVIGRSDGTGLIFRSGVGETMFCGGKSVVEAGDCGGAVNVNLQAGEINVSGANSWGVVMESENVSFQELNQFTNKDWSIATLNVSNGGWVVAQGQAEGAVLLNASGGSTVVNAGVIDGSQSAGGYAINSVGKSYKVTNQSSGVIRGSFGSKCSGQCTDVGAAPASIDNQGLIESGPTVDLSGGALSNHGVVSVGGDGVIGATLLNGDFMQSSSGALNVDINTLTGEADKLNVTGKAVVGGSVAVAHNVLRKTGPVTILSAAGGLTLPGTSAAEVARPAGAANAGGPSPASASTSAAPHEVAAVSGPAAASLGPALFTDDLSVAGNDLQVTTNAHFVEAAAVLGGGQQAVAGHLQEVWESGARMDATFDALHAINTDAGAFAVTLNGISGQVLGAVDSVRYQVSKAFVDNMTEGCPPDRADASGGCFWLRAAASHTDQSASRDYLGYTVNGEAAQLGFVVPFGDNLSFAASFGYGDNNLKGDGGVVMDGKDLRGGAMLAYRSGPWEFSGAVDAGAGSYDSARYFPLGNTAVVAQANPQTWDAGLHLRAEYDYAIADNWYLTPFAAFSVSHAHSDAFVERGAPELGLEVDSDSDTVWSGRAGVELAGEMKLGANGGTTLRPFARAAVEVLDDGDWAARARFTGQGATDGFKASIRLPDTLGDVAVGVELQQGKSWSLQAEYAINFGEHYTDQTGALRFAAKF
jgi:hypothetical protein